MERAASTHIQHQQHGSGSSANGGSADKVQAALRQFQTLSDKANRRFNKIRDAQEQQSSWTSLQAQFVKGFACFNELWKFQLENR